MKKLRHIHPLKVNKVHAAEHVSVPQSFKNFIF